MDFEYALSASHEGIGKIRKHTLDGEGTGLSSYVVVSWHNVGRDVMVFQSFKLVSRNLQRLWMGSISIHEIAGMDEKVHIFFYDLIHGLLKRLIEVFFPGFQMVLTISKVSVGNVCKPCHILSTILLHSFSSKGSKSY